MIRETILKRYIGRKCSNLPGDAVYDVHRGGGAEIIMLLLDDLANDPNIIWGMRGVCECGGQCRGRTNISR